MKRASAQEEFAKADWRKVGLRLLLYTRYWAKTHYGWQDGRLLPTGKTPEDVACDVYEAFKTGERKFNSDIPLMVQLKSAVKSVLWNLHQLKEGKLTSAEEPEFFEPFADGRANPGVAMENEDYVRRFLELLRVDTKVARQRDLAAMVTALEKGAEAVTDFCELTGLPEARVYEMRRQLKAAAERVLTKLNENRGQYEQKRSRHRATLA